VTDCRGVKKYDSREGWEIKHDGDLDAVAHRIEALRMQLAGDAPAWETSDHQALVRRSVARRLEVLA
jgi:hypothetical protein